MNTLKTFEQLPLKEQRRLKQLAKQIGYKEISKAKTMLINKMKGGDLNE